ncbi:MAG: SMP-30/gluconolactonase/LRE family protein [Acidimicrobiia bacterium]
MSNARNAAGARTPHRRRLLAGAALATLLTMGSGVLAPSAGTGEPPGPNGAPAPDAAPARGRPALPGPAETWGRAADVEGPNGLFVGGPDGLIYQGSVAGNELDVVDPHSGEVLDRIGAERGVRGPDDVYVTDDGTIYWTEIFQGNVGMLEPDGTWRIQHVALGTNPITMNAEGRLFTALDFLGNGLYELDPDLIEPPRLLLADIDTLNGFGFGPDGYLYGPLFFDHRVVRIDVDATPPTVETVADGFRVPSGVEFDSQGRMIVTDFAEGQVIRIDLETGARETIFDIEGMLDNSAVGPDDTVYTAAFGDGVIWAIDPSGESRQVTEGGLISAGGVAVDGDGSVLVADWFAMKRYTDGELSQTFYDRFDPPGEGMSGPNTVAVDGDRLVITGYFSNVLQILDGHNADVITDVRDLKTPTNAIVHGGGIAVAQAGAATGAGPGSVVRLEDRGVLMDGLTLPTGLASDGTTLYVADWATGDVWRTGDGAKVRVAAGLNHPEGIALTGDGRLLVAEEGIDQVTAIDLANGDRRGVAHVALGDDYAPGLLPYGMLTGIAMAPDGGFWVTSDVDNVVHRFDL